MSSLKFTNPLAFINPLSYGEDLASKKTDKLVDLSIQKKDELGFGLINTSDYEVIDGDTIKNISTGLEHRLQYGTEGQSLDTYETFHGDKFTAKKETQEKLAKQREQLLNQANKDKWFPWTKLDQEDITNEQVFAKGEEAKAKLKAVFDTNKQLQLNQWGKDELYNRSLTDIKTVGSDKSLLNELNTPKLNPGYDYKSNAVQKLRDSLYGKTSVGDVVKDAVASFGSGMSIQGGEVLLGGLNLVQQATKKVLALGENEDIKDAINNAPSITDQLQNIGYDPNRTKQILDPIIHSQGFLDKSKELEKINNTSDDEWESAIASIEWASKNPEHITTGLVAESLPMMLMGMGITGKFINGIKANVATRLAGASEEYIAKATSQVLKNNIGKIIGVGAIAEGSQTAGLIANQADLHGRTQDEYALPAFVAGLSTGGINVGLGRLAAAEINLLTKGALGGFKGNAVTKLVKAISGETLEEGLQSYPEQVLTNIAEGEDNIFKGTGSQTALGAIAGGITGGGMITPQVAADTLRTALNAHSKTKQEETVQAAKSQVEIDSEAIKTVTEETGLSKLNQHITNIVGSKVSTDTQIDILNQFKDKDPDSFNKRKEELQPKLDELYQQSTEKNDPTIEAITKDETTGNFVQTKLLSPQATESIQTVVKTYTDSFVDKTIDVNTVDPKQVLDHIFRITTALEAEVKPSKEKKLSYKTAIEESIAVYSAIAQTQGKYTSEITTPVNNLNTAPNIPLKSFQNDEAQAYRNHANNIGSIPLIEKLFAQSLTAKQVQIELEKQGFLKGIDSADKSGYVTLVRATLGIPSKMGTSAADMKEFNDWLDSYNKRTLNPSTTQSTITTIHPHQQRITNFLKKLEEVYVSNADMNVKADVDELIKSNFGSQEPGNPKSPTPKQLEEAANSSDEELSKKAKLRQKIGAIYTELQNLLGNTKGKAERYEQTKTDILERGNKKPAIKSHQANIELAINSSKATKESVKTALSPMFDWLVYHSMKAELAQNLVNAHASGNKEAIAKARLELPRYYVDGGILDTQQKPINDKGYTPEQFKNLSDQIQIESYAIRLVYNYLFKEAINKFPDNEDYFWNDSEFKERELVDTEIVTTPVVSEEDNSTVQTEEDLNNRFNEEQTANTEKSKPKETKISDAIQKEFELWNKVKDRFTNLFPGINLHIDDAEINESDEGLNQRIRKGDAYPLVKHITNGIELAEWLSKRSVNPVIRHVAKHISNKLNLDLQVEFPEVWVKKPSIAGYYTVNTNKVVFNKDKVTEVVLLHELLHAATQDIIQYGNSEESFKVRKQLVDFMFNLQNEISKDISSGLLHKYSDLTYFLKYAVQENKAYISEMIAVIFSDSEVQDYLANKPSRTNVSLFSEFTSFIAKLLGFKTNETNLLTEFISIGERYINLNNEEFISKQNKVILEREYLESLPINNIPDEEVWFQKDLERITGQANINAMTVLINSSIAKLDTLPHEYAHHYISWFRETAIVKNAINKYGTEEALVQAIGEQVIAQKGIAYNWWKKFSEWILNKLNLASNLEKEQLKNLLTDALLTAKDLSTNVNRELLGEGYNKYLQATKQKSKLPKSNEYDNAIAKETTHPEQVTAQNEINSGLNANKLSELRNGITKKFGNLDSKIFEYLTSETLEEDTVVSRINSIAKGLAKTDVKDKNNKDYLFGLELGKEEDIKAKEQFIKDNPFSAEVNPKVESHLLKNIESNVNTLLKELFTGTVNNKEEIRQQLIEDARLLGNTNTPIADLKGLNYKQSWLKLDAYIPRAYISLNINEPSTVPVVAKQIDKVITKAYVLFNTMLDKLAGKYAPKLKVNALIDEISFRKKKAWFKQYPEFFNRLDSNPLVNEIIITENGKTALASTKSFVDTFSNWFLKSGINTEYLNNGKPNFNFDIEESPIELLLRHLPENKTRIIDPNIISSIAVTTLQWLSANGTGLLFNDKQTVRKLLGIDDGEELNPDVFKAMSTMGSVRSYIATQLGKAITKSLGFKPTNDTEIAMFNKLETSLGLYALNILHNMNYVEYSQISNDTFNSFRNNEYKESIAIPKGDTPVVMVKLVTEDNSEGEFAKPKREIVDLLADIKKGRKELEALFESSFGKEMPRTEPMSLKEYTEYLGGVEGIGLDPGDLLEQPNYTRSPTEYSNQDIYDGHNYHQVAYKVNTPVNTVFKQLTDRDIQDMYLGRDSDQPIQQEFIKEEEGKFRAFELELEDIKESEKLANEKDGLLYFTSVMWKQGRVGMIRGSQNSKMMRWVFGVKDFDRTISLDDKPQMHNYMATVLAAFGAKIEEIQTIEELETKFYKTVESNKVIMKDFLNSEGFTKEVKRDAIERLKQAVIEGGEGFHTLAGLVAMSAWYIANETGEESFQTNIAYESDGKTNGVAIGLVLFSAIRDYSNAAQQNLLNASAMYGDATMTYPEWRNQINPVTGRKNADNYEMIRDSALARKPILDQDIIDAQAYFTWQQREQTLRYMDSKGIPRTDLKALKNISVSGYMKQHGAFAPDIEHVRAAYDFMQIQNRRTIQAIPVHNRLEAVHNIVGEINRNFTKYPLMITVFGAALQKVAKAIAEDSIISIHKRLEKIYLSDKSTEEKFREVSEIETHIYNLTGKHTELEIDILNQDKEALLTFNLSKYHRDLIKEVISTVYYPIMKGAIEENYSEFMNNRAEVNKVFTVINEILRIAIKQRIEAFSKDNGKEMSSSEFDAMLKELQAIQPAIATPTSKGLNQKLSLWKASTSSPHEAKYKTQVLFKHGKKKLKYYTVNANEEYVAHEIDLPASASAHAVKFLLTTMGVRPAIMSIHNVDSYPIKKMMRSKFKALLVHDAKITALDEVQESDLLMNQELHERLATHDVFKAALDSLKLAEEFVNKDPELLKVVDRFFGSNVYEQATMTQSELEELERLFLFNQGDYLGIKQIESLNEYVQVFSNFAEVKENQKQTQIINNIKASGNYGGRFPFITNKEVPLTGNKEEQIASIIESGLNQSNTNTKPIESNLYKPTTPVINIYSGDKNGFNGLSNFINGTVTTTIKGKEYIFPTVEHYYQAMKAIEAKDAIAWNAIRKAKSGLDAQKLSKTIKGLDTKTWDTKSEQVLEEGMRLAFEQNPNQVNLLLSTGNAQLTHKSKFNLGKWETVFPEILMRIRKDYQNTKPEVKPSEYTSTIVSMSELTNHSGGAYGGDTLWDIIGRTFGVVNHNHYREASNAGLSAKLKKAKVSATIISKQQLESARQAVKDLLGKSYPDTLQGNLQVRNYYQVANSDGVFAVAKLTKDYLGVMGGTNTAVQLGIKLNKPTYVWDVISESWFKWNGNYFNKTDTPVLTKNFAGVGTRDIENYNVLNKTTNQWESRKEYVGKQKEDAAIQAIKDVYQKTKDSLNTSTQTNEDTNIGLEEQYLQEVYPNSIITFHGSKDWIEEIDTSKLGETTKAKSALLGMFSTNDENLANDYAQLALKNVTISEEESNFLKAIDKKRYTAKSIVSEEEENKYEAIINKLKSTINEVKINEFIIDISNYKIIDMGHKTILDLRKENSSLTSQLTQAKNEGYSGVVMKDIIDSPYSSTSATNYITFNPNEITVYKSKKEREVFSKWKESKTKLGLNNTNQPNIGNFLLSKEEIVDELMVFIDGIAKDNISNNIDISSFVDKLYSYMDDDGDLVPGFTHGDLLNLKDEYTLLLNKLTKSTNSNTKVNKLYSKLSDKQQVIIRERLANPPKGKLYKEILQNLSKELGITSQQINEFLEWDADVNDNFLFSQENTTTNLFQNSLGNIDSTNVLNTAERLENVGNVRDEDTHITHLKSILGGFISKVLQPLQYFEMTSPEANIGEYDPSGKIGLNISNAPIAPTVKVPMSALTTFVHELVHGVTASALFDPKNSILRSRVQKIFNHIERNISNEDKEKYSHIFANKNKTQLANGTFVNHGLAELIAFAETEPMFRELLNSLPKMTVGKITETWDESKDKFVEANLLEVISNVFNKIMVWWNDKIKGEHSTDVLTQLHTLTVQLSTAHLKAKSTIYDFKLLSDKSDNFVLNKLHRLLVEPLLKLLGNNYFTLNPNKNAAAMSNSARDLLNAPGSTKAKVDKLFEFTDIMKKRLNISEEHWLTYSLNEITGQIAVGNFTQALNMTKKLRDKVVATIQNTISSNLRSGFKTNLTKQLERVIYNTLLKTDLSSLQDYYKDDLLNMFDGSKRKVEQDKLKKEILKNKNGKLYLGHAYNTAFYMVHNQATKSFQHSTLMNATQIYNMYGSNFKPVGDENSTVELIDKLIGLYTLDLVNQEELNTLKDLFNTDSHGLNITMEVHRQQKENHLNDILKGNKSLVVKGSTKELTNPNRQIIIATAAEEEKLKLNHYTKGNKIYYEGKELYVYHSKFRLMQPWVQGIISYTHMNNILNDMKGVMKQSDGLDQIIQDEKLDKSAKAKMLQENLANANKTVFDTTVADYTLNPVFNGKGYVSKHSFMLSNQDKENLLDMNTNFTHVLGAMVANITDKLNTQRLNDESAKMLIKDRMDNLETKGIQWVTLSKDAKTKNERDIWNKLPKEFKETILKLSGSEEVVVNAKLLKMIFGQRKLSLSDFFRPADEQELSVFVKYFGSQLYPYIKKANLDRTTQVWQEGISYVKDLLVVKSGTVLMGNEISNFWLGYMEGMTVKQYVKAKTEALKLVIEYHKLNTQINDIGYLLKYDKEMSSSMRTNLETKLSNLTTVRNNSLVKKYEDAGQMKTIVEDGLEDENIWSFRNEFFESRIKSVTDKLPKPIKAIGREVFMTHDTKMYQLMKDLTQMSDLTSRIAVGEFKQSHGMTEKGALQLVDEAFINYDIPSHQNVQFAADMGLFMFNKFFFRIQSVIAREVGQHPARFLTLLGMEQMFGAQEAIHHSLMTPDTLVGHVSNPLKLPYAIWDSNFYNWLFSFHAPAFQPA